MRDTIVEAIDFLAKIVNESGVMSKFDEAFILDAEEVLAIALNQIAFIKQVTYEQEIHA